MTSLKILLTNSNTLVVFLKQRININPLVIINTFSITNIFNKLEKLAYMLS